MGTPPASCSLDSFARLLCGSGCVPGGVSFSGWNHLPAEAL